MIAAICIYVGTSKPKSATKYFGKALYIGKDGLGGLRSGKKYKIVINFNYNLKWDYELVVIGVGVWNSYASREAIEKNWVLYGHSGI